MSDETSESPRSERSPIESSRSERSPIESSRSEKTPIESSRSEKTPIESSRSEKTPIESSRSEKTPIESPRSEKSPVESPPPVQKFRGSKTLSEKIRELGIVPQTRKTSTLQQIDIKLEENRGFHYTVMVANLNLGQITYFQPEISYDEANPEKNFYRISHQDRSLPNLSNITRISDIQVKSYRPRRSLKFRSKRRSSLINRVEMILSKHSADVSRDPSEESIEIVTPQRAKDINDLPESVLQRIFLNFTVQERNTLLSRVCKSWYYMLKDPIFWSELEFHGDRVDESTILNLIKRYPTMEKLCLIAVPSVVEVLQELCRCNNSIKHLSVKHCDVSSMDFSRIIHRVITCCTNLEVLDIKGMSFQSEGFYLDLGRLKNLRSINLTGNNLLRSQDLVTLSVNCRNLQEFKILELSLDHEEGPALRDEDVTFILCHLQQKLRTLKLDMQQLRNVSYQAILKCSNLTNLGLKNCLYLSSEAFRQFPVLRQLRKFKITRAINLKSADFQFVFNSGNLRKIENLDINGCWGVGEVGLRAITLGLGALRNLSLKNCKSIKGRYLVHLSRCHHLTDLNLAHTAVESNQLPSLYQYVRGLQSLVIDTNMQKQSMIRQLRRFYPSLKISISYSEYQKDERPLSLDKIS